MGRPTKSRVRQNLVDMLLHRKKAYGYQLYKDYCELFPDVTMRLIYYHLRKGVATGEFEVENVSLEAGDYSWGGQAEKIYYRLGPKASPRSDRQRMAKIERYYRKSSDKKHQKQ